MNFTSLKIQSYYNINIQNYYICLKTAYLLADYKTADRCKQTDDLLESLALSTGMAGTPPLILYWYFQSGGRECGYVEAFYYEIKKRLLGSWSQGARYCGVGWRRRKLFERDIQVIKKRFDELTFEELC